MNYFWHRQAFDQCTSTQSIPKNSREFTKLLHFIHWSMQFDCVVLISRACSINNLGDNGVLCVMFVLQITNQCLCFCCIFLLSEGSERTCGERDWPALGCLQHHAQEGSEFQDTMLNARVLRCQLFESNQQVSTYVLSSLCTVVSLEWIWTLVPWVFTFQTWTNWTSFHFIPIQFPSLGEKSVLKSLSL